MIKLAKVKKRISHHYKVVNCFCGKPVSGYDRKTCSLECSKIARRKSILERYSKRRQEIKKETEKILVLRQIMTIKEIAKMYNMSERHVLTALKSLKS